jgi:hypothetical protein
VLLVTGTTFGGSASGPCHEAHASGQDGLPRAPTILWLHSKSATWGAAARLLGHQGSDCLGFRGQPLLLPPHSASCNGSASL